MMMIDKLIMMVSDSKYCKLGYGLFFLFLGLLNHPTI